MVGLLGVYTGQEQAPDVDYDYLLSAQALDYTLNQEEL